MNNDILLQEFGKSLYDFNAYLKNITSSESFSREELESLKGLQRAVMICARRYYNAIDVSPEIIKLINTDDIKKFKDNLKELINKTTSDIKANKNTLQNKHKLHSLLKPATMIANESMGSLLKKDMMLASAIIIEALYGGITAIVVAATCTVAAVVSVLFTLPAFAIMYYGGLSPKGAVALSSGMASMSDFFGKAMKHAENVFKNAGEKTMVYLERDTLDKALDKMVASFDKVRKVEDQLISCGNAPNKPAPI